MVILNVEYCGWFVVNGKYVLKRRDICMEGRASTSKALGDHEGANVLTMEENSM